MTNIFYDTIEDDSPRALEDHAPNTGDSWTKILYGTGGDEYFKINTAEHHILDENGGASDYILYSADSTYSTADYYMSVYADTLDNNDDVSYLILRMTASNTYYALEYNEDVFQIYINNGGSWSTIGSNAGAVASDGDTIKFQVEGTTLSAYVNDVEKASGTNSTISSAGSAGLGMGNLRGVGNDCSVQRIGAPIIVATTGEEPPASTSEIWINVDDTFRNVTEQWVNVNDVWRKVDESYINKDDAWRKIT